MRGEPGTGIKLTIVRPGRDKPFDVSMVRERIQLHPVKWEVKDGIAIIDINTFSGNAAEETQAAMMAANKATGGRPLGYIIDLRSNPGGLLDQAVEISDVFLNRGEIVSQRGREKTDIERYYAKAGDMAQGAPIIVLVDAGTASAAEIVAGALQDQRRALVMGEKSFGKGSVQTVVQTGPRSALRLTTARYYTPSGTSIQATGIVPDIVIEQELPEDMKADADRSLRGEASLRGHLKGESGEEASGSSSYVPPDKKDDKQLQAAIDFLHGKTVTPTVQTVDQRATKGATSPAEPEAPVKN
jgi:carboxyl-terminal processing protease